MNDRKMVIATAGSRYSTKWVNQEIWWSELLQKFKNPVRSQETLEVFLKKSKKEQDDLKDQGGYVGGKLLDGRRNAKSVAMRDIITLDFDNIPSLMAEDCLQRLSMLGCAYAAHSTRKHEAIRPRLRVIVPLNKSSTVEEYEPLARKVAQLICLDWADPTTFQAPRLMYWPSCSSDSIYVFKAEDKPFLDVDATLKLYADWRNHAEWPKSEHEAVSFKHQADKQQDPENKAGIVGAFCKTYDIYRAMDELLPGAYVPTEQPDRFTYTGGSTAGGAVVYEGKWLFSHHATDPASGVLCNAWDLVRLHKFAELDYDAKPNTPSNTVPSFKAMVKFAAGMPEVSTRLTKERYESAGQDFGVAETTESDENWVSVLKTNSAGVVEKTINNILLILENDPFIKGKIAYDEFANRGVVLGLLPWANKDEKRWWTDTDDAGLRHYLERVFGITGKEKIMDAVALCAAKHAFNTVREYVSGLTWDGVPRLDTLFIDYLGAEDNAYVRAATRKTFVAAVARVMKPGTKFDNMIILAGAQGIGKSTMLSILGKDWFSDSLTTFEGKEAAELIQGTWINEIGELSGLSRSEVNTVKLFLSKTEDIYREAYGRRTAKFPRQCIFIGTTNDLEFLKDPTGGRRFWPIDVGERKSIKSVFKDLRGEVDQIWAEAYIYFKLGEPLYLSEEAEALAKTEQEQHREVSPKEGRIIDFLEIPVPEDWGRYSLEQRLAYLAFDHKNYTGAKALRDKICAAEVWVECFQSNINAMKRYDAVEINHILRGIKGLVPIKQAHRFGCYGTQKGFRIEADFHRKKLQL